MKKIILLQTAVLLIVFHCLVFNAVADEITVGKVSFEKNCISCHRDGGNIINAAKPVRVKEMKAAGIKTPADIVKKMRNPGPGMLTYDEKQIPDREARTIAEYILKTFK